MASRSQNWKLKVNQMTCAHCEMKVEQIIKAIDPALRVKVSYSRSEAVITSENPNIDFLAIKKALDDSGYPVSDISKTTESDKWSALQLVGFAVVLIGLYVAVQNTIGFNFIPEVKPGMGYGVLFVIGLLTSLHCISMCGGINLSQCIVSSIEPIEPNPTKKWMQKVKPSFLYNGGRVVSYTVIGGIVGALGSAISFSNMAKGMVTVATGLFMIVMGLNMLSLFPWLRRLNPKMPKFFARLQLKNSTSNRPFYVGLLNGLIPCGPLQAMQLFALGTGSALTGALSMFAFSIGTTPLMFGFGALSSLMSRKFTNQMLKISALLVIFLGFVMMGRGFALNGVDVVKNTEIDGYHVAIVADGVQTLITPLESSEYPVILVQKGIPVRWVIEADASVLNGCNNRINLYPYDQMDIPLSVGETVIEFTPDETGTFNYSCWMGMVGGQIKVVEDISAVDTSFAENEKAIQVPNENPTGGCCAP